MTMQWRLALSLTFALIATPVLADTASEVRQEILDNMTHMNQALNQDPMRISKLGSKEFFFQRWLAQSYRQDIKGQFV